MFPPLFSSQAVWRNELSPTRRRGGRDQNDSLWIPHMVTPPISNPPPAARMDASAHRCSCLKKRHCLTMQRWMDEEGRRKEERERDQWLYNDTSLPRHWLDQPRINQLQTVHFLYEVHWGQRATKYCYGAAWDFIFPFLWSCQQLEYVPNICLRSF